MNLSLYLISVVAVAYLTACLAMFFYQRSLIYFAQPRVVTDPETTMVPPHEQRGNPRDHATVGKSESDHIFLWKWRRRVAKPGVI